MSSEIPNTNLHHKLMDAGFNVPIEFTDEELKEYFKSNPKAMAILNEHLSSERFVHLNITNYYENAELFWERQPYFYDDSGSFWFWDIELKKWKMVDEVDIMRIFDKVLGFEGQTISATCKNSHLEAFKRYGREKHPKEPKKNWVQFRDKIFDADTKQIILATPEYFICNPIPHELGISEETPLLDKLFKEWVGEEYVKTLYEILAYCCLTNYPVHLVFAFIGCGRNGKTTFQNFIKMFIGEENVSSTELDALLESRFESGKLYKKLVCTVGETNFNLISKTSLLKKLCGQDLCGIEFKNKQPFDFVNYAKILINSNSLPTSLDNSEGFYRRFLIIDFPNEFPEGKSILDTIPAPEIQNLALKVTKLLPELILRGSFTNQGTISERRHKYVLASNPLTKFLDIACSRDPTYFVRYNELFNAYQTFLFKMKRRQVTNKEFKSVLSEENLLVERTSKNINGEFVSSWFVFGIKLRKEWEKLCNLCNLCSFSETEKTEYRENIKKVHNSHNQHKNQDINGFELFNDKLSAPCVECCDTAFYLNKKSAKPYCKQCAERFVEEESVE